MAVTAAGVCKQGNVRLFGGVLCSNVRWEVPKWQIDGIAGKSTRSNLSVTNLTAVVCYRSTTCGTLLLCFRCMLICSPLPTMMTRMLAAYSPIWRSQLLLASVLFRATAAADNSSCVHGAAHCCTCAHCCTLLPSSSPVEARQLGRPVEAGALGRAGEIADAALGRVDAARPVELHAHPLAVRGGVPRDRAQVPASARNHTTRARHRVRQSTDQPTHPPNRPTNTHTSTRPHLILPLMLLLLPSTTMSPSDSCCCCSAAGRGTPAPLLLLARRAASIANGRTWPSGSSPGVLMTLCSSVQRLGGG